MERLHELEEDVVSDLLQGVEVRSVVYCLSELRAPWGFRVEASTVAKFHLVLDGSCLITLDTGETVEAGTGELVLMPRGHGHTVQDRPDSPVRHLDRILDDTPLDSAGRLVYGGDGVTTRLLCGGFGLTEQFEGSLLGLLPVALTLDSGVVTMGRWLAPILAIVQEHAGARERGQAAVVAKVADVFLTETLRTYLVGAEQAGLLQLEPLRDPAIARAVDLLRTHAARPWTVAELAREVGMSRTSFAAKFQQLVGATPMRYLTRLRLGQAAGFLATTNANLFSVARRSGYESESSFSKAFKREFGEAPGDYRRRRSGHQVGVGVEPLGAADALA